MIGPEEAWERLEPWLIQAAAARTLALPRAAAAGRIAAQAIAASTDVPSSDISALDGFAFAGDPGVGRPAPVAGSTLAGQGEGAALPAGAARRIMTGAPLPPGADRVLGFEDVAVAGESVTAGIAVAAGAAVRRRGEVVARGGALLAPGTRLSPAALALLASQGIDEVVVRAPPAVEVVVTGDEVVRGAALAAGQVRDSHSDFLAAELGRLGIQPFAGDVERDDAAALGARLERALARADVLLTCGGVSMGDADLVPAALERLGCEILFHGLAIQPGKPLLAARRGGRLIFGLPGNPGSVMTSWWLFVKPALERLAGGEGRFWSGALNAHLHAPLNAGRGRDRFVPARLRAIAGRLEAIPILPKGSHDLIAFAAAEALLRVRAGDPARAAGDSCELLRID